MSILSADQQIQVLDTYAITTKSVFYMWAGAMACCLVVMIFVKDQGLTRNEEKKQQQNLEDLSTP